MGTIPVYNVVDYGAIGDGNVANATTNTNAFNAAITAIHNSNGPGILYVPTSVPASGHPRDSQGFVINNGNITISDSNVILQGAGGMGASGGAGASTIIGYGGGNTITITGMGCAVRDLAFAPSGAQNGSYLYISANQGQVLVDNVHMQSPNVGITLYQPPGSVGEYWIERLLIEGAVTVGGIDVNVGSAAVCMRHVLMDNSASTQPQFGIRVTNAGEVVICDGTDIGAMGNCLQITPGEGQAVVAVFVSDTLFDGGNGAGCVVIQPSGNGYVLTVRFSNVWASTGNNPNNTNGFTFVGSGSTSPFPSILDVSLVNCVGKGFTNHDGLLASNVVGLSVASSTFGGNYVGINIAGGMSNFVLDGNKCGNYTPNPPGGNTVWGILINPGASDHYVITNNLLAGNGTGGLYDGGTGTHKAVANNVS